jgi:hypothetical protein
MRLALRLMVFAACASPSFARAQATLAESGTCAGVRERVAVLAGADPFVPTGGTTITVATQALADGASGTLSVAVDGRPVGHRALAAASCAALVDDLALAIVVVLAAPPAVAPAAPPDAVENPPARVFAAAPAVAAWQLGMLGGVAASSQGSTAVDVGLRAKHDAWSLAAVLALPAQENLAITPGTVRVSRGEIALLPCLHAGRAAACADVTGGWIRGTGAGFTASTAHTMPFAATGVRLVWEQPVSSWFAVQGYAEGRVALTSNRFFIDDMAVWTGARADASLGIAVVAHIP